MRPVLAITAAFTYVQRMPFPPVHPVLDAALLRAAMLSHISTIGHTPAGSKRAGFARIGPHRVRQNGGIWLGCRGHADA